MLRIYLFGTAEVDPGTGEAVPLSSQKAAELLAYLWLHRDRLQARTQLAGLLWPETDEKRARQSLRTALHRLRQELETDDDGAELLLTDRQSVQFNPELRCWVDVGQFLERLAEADEAEDEERLRLLEEAVSVYRDDLLRDCYEDWCLEERDHLKDRYLQALENLVAAHADRKAYEPAIEYAKEILAVNPLQEEIHRQLMYLYYAQEDRNAALRQYRDCERLLDEELGIEPLPETQALAREIEERVSPEHLEAVSPQAIISKYPELGAPFVGRVEEFARLKAAWNRASEGQGGSLFVSGEAGIGKTRLTQELADHVGRVESGIVLRGACYETEGRLPYQPWIEAFRQGVGAVSEDALNQLSGLWIGEVMKLVPELAERFPEVRPRSALASPEQEKNRLFEGLARFLLELAESQPLLIFLDDLQWADESTLQFTHYLMRKLQETPICLVGVYRSGDVGEDHPTLDTIQHALKEGIVEVLELSALTGDEINELVGRMLKAEAGIDPLIDKINADSEGNPFFAVELLKSFIEAGAVRVRDDGAWEVETKKLTEPDLPQTVRAVVETRLRRLSRSSREVAHLASTRSQTFDVDFVAEAIGRRTDDVEVYLDELSRSDFFVAEGPRYRFQHDVIREVIYRGLTDERRRTLHLQSGRTLETLRERSDDGDENGLAGEIAEHFYQAEDWRKALDYSLHAGELAWSQSYAKDEALHFYERALAAAEQLEDQAGLMKAYKGIGEVCAFTDEPERGLESCEEALNLCDDPVTRAEIYCAIANVDHQRRELEEGLAHAEKALEELGPDHGETLTAVQAHYYASTFLNWLQRYADAIEHCERALAILDKESSANWKALVYSELGGSYSRQGRHEEAADYLSESAQLAEEAGDLYALALAHFETGLAQRYAGQVEAAISTMEESLDAISRMTGRYDETASIYNHLVYLYLLSEELSRAFECAQRQYESQVTAGAVSNIATACGMLACLYEIQGDTVKAEEMFNEALKLGAHHGAMYLNIIDTFIHLDRPLRAIEWLERGVSHLQKRHIQHLKAPPYELTSYNDFREEPRFGALVEQWFSEE